jgi:hypothetical protein
VQIASDAKAIAWLRGCGKSQTGKRCHDNGNSAGISPPRQRIGDYLDEPAPRVTARDHKAPLYKKELDPRGRDRPGVWILIFCESSLPGANQGYLSVPSDLGETRAPKMKLIEPTLDFPDGFPEAAGC